MYTAIYLRHLLGSVGEGKVRGVVTDSGGVTIRTNLWLFTPELCAAHSLREKSPEGVENTLFSLLFG